MEPLVFKRKSWHFFFANLLGGKFEHARHINLCEYIWCLFFGIVASILGFSMTLLLIYCFIDAFAWAAACVVYWTLVTQGPAAMAGMFVLCLFIGLGCLMCIAMLMVWLNERKSKPTLIGTAYRGFKDKVCLRITLL